MTTNFRMGFRMRAATFAKSMQIINTFRPWVEEVAEQKMDTFIARIDAEPDRKSSGYDTWVELREKAHKLGKPDPQVDTDFALYLLPRGSFLMGICETENHAWFEEWCRQPGIDAFSYWDDAERPQGVSETEWEERKQAWEVVSAVTTSEAISMQAFFIDLVNPFGPLPPHLRPTVAGTSMPIGTPIVSLEEEQWVPTATKLPTVGKFVLCRLQHRSSATHTGSCWLKRVSGADFTVWQQHDGDTLSGNWDVVEWLDE